MLNEKIKVKDIMEKDVASVTVPGTRSELLELCKAKYISGAPVLKNGKVVGVVTRQDLLKKPNESQIALLMSRDPITISPDASVEEAAEIIITNKIRRLPVVSGEKLIGLLSVADIARKIAGMGYTEPIANYMAANTMTIWEDTPLSVVGRIMELAGVKAVPVLNTKLELVGLLTDRDLINAAVIEDSTEEADLSLGSDEDAWTWEGMRDTMRLYYSVSKIKLPDKVVKDIMVKPVITATRNSGVSECAKRMCKSRFDQLPIVIVTAGGKLTGMIRDRDLLNVLI